MQCSGTFEYFSFFQSRYFLSFLSVQLQCSYKNTTISIKSRSLFVVAHRHHSKMAVEASANKCVTHSSYLVTSSSVQHIYPIGYRKLPNPSLIRICSTQTDSKLHWRTFVRTSKHMLDQSLGMTHMHGSHVARRLIRSLHCVLALETNI